MSNEDYEEEDEMPEMSEKEDYEIVVPSLAEIIVPLGLPDQINEREESQLPSSEPITEVGAYRHVRPSPAEEKISAFRQCWWSRSEVEETGCWQRRDSQPEQ